VIPLRPTITKTSFSARSFAEGLRSISAAAWPDGQNGEPTDDGGVKPGVYPRRPLFAKALNQA
jgi:hypothetical protein